MKILQGRDGRIVLISIVGDIGDNSALGRSESLQMPERDGYAWQYTTPATPESRGSGQLRSLIPMARALRAMFGTGIG